MRLHASIFEAPQPSQALTAASSRPDPLGPTDPPIAPGPSRAPGRDPDPFPDPALRSTFDRSRSHLVVFGLGLCLSSLVACAPHAPAPFWPAEPELVEVESRGPGRLFVHRDQALDRYDEVQLHDVGLRYRAGQARIAADDERRVLAMLVAAIEGDPERPVARASHPGPCVLAVDYFLTELELDAEPRRTNRSTELRASLGEATLVLEMRDSQSEAVVARFVERRNLGGGRWLGGRREQLDRLEDMIGQAVDDLGGKLQRIAPTNAERASTERDERCRGTILRVARGTH